MGRTKLIRNRVYKYLEENKSARSDEILDYLNDNWRHGVSSSCLSNVLGKDAYIESCGETKIGQTYGAGPHGSTYKVKIWRLTSRYYSEEGKHNGTHLRCFIER